jgi:hypothetical protein
MTVAPAAIRINSLAASQVAGAADDPFTISVGVTDATEAGLTSVQTVRFGSPGVVVTVTSSVPTAGLLVRNGVTSATATVTIPAGAGTTPTTVIDGILFRPVSTTGSPTRVSATAPGAISTAAAAVNVTVTP